MAVAENNLENQDVRKELNLMQREDTQPVAQVLEKSSNNTPEDFRKDNPDDFNYEDPLIAALLDKDWDAERGIHHSPEPNASTNELVRKNMVKDSAPKKKNNMQRADPCPPKASRKTKILLRGESSKKNQSKGFISKMDVITVQETSQSSEEDEEITPVSNRYQSWQDMDIMPDAENPYILDQVNENTTEEEDFLACSFQEGQTVDTPVHEDLTILSTSPTLMQEFILKDAAAANKLKRNKSTENIKQGNKEATTGGKGKRSRGNSAPKPPKRHTMSSSSSSLQFK
ncbi:UNVERIFIED_CONTAM: hypothetical protein Sradi_0486300 [Sesamum radiatum]|uniref:Uncharacterized protein n=1 Tax=Sesamum radiatum TaxID=300843 RepID=A0AAW2W7H6_SESRA